MNIGNTDKIMLMNIIAEWLTDARYLIGWVVNKRLADKARCVVISDRVINGEADRVPEFAAALANLTAAPEKGGAQ